MDSYEKFLISNKLFDFQQSKEWAKVKTLWKNEIITVCDNDKIVLSISILIRKLPFFWIYHVCSERSCWNYS